MHEQLNVDEDTMPPRPLGRYGQLETDAFCAGCGYNLHGQDVSLDERLGFLVCRCPECGRFHPAGTGTSANSLWQSRFASILLVLWMCFVLGFTVLAGFALGGLQVGFVDSYCWMQSPKGGVYAGRWMYTMQMPEGIDPQNALGVGFGTLLCSLGAALGFFVGTLAVSFLWHWPRRRYLLLALLPALAAGVVLSAFFNDPSYLFIRAWCVKGTLTMLACEIAGFLLAARFGRPLARLIVRSIIPPKPRQLLAFLWRADGLVMPAGGTGDARG